MRCRCSWPEESAGVMGVLRVLEPALTPVCGASAGRSVARRSVGARGGAGFVDEAGRVVRTPPGDAVEGVDQLVEAGAVAVGVQLVDVAVVRGIER